ncbi:putative Retinol dehydrogenase 12 [Glarea lozoyensis 74030]|uniref:Putative Retinol dehydrogenase 12 n=1 Tax=Glarea lozoyensis (strain ATCC 74030 / MF5533) TaxID=1104152 RepID=H0ECT9_GLAL7|nr:putative Retinol dehydrogenase 12 [Glarea lozoyensis 74030]
MANPASGWSMDANTAASIHMMAAPVLDSRLKLASEKRITFGAFLYRQFFVTPTLPRDVDLKGKTAIVTGSNTGIGLECARQLLDLGLGKLIIAVRDERKGQAARTQLLSGRRLENSAIEVWKLDLASYDSVVAFAERSKSLEHLDIVVLNAAVMKVEHRMVESTGHEETLQVNVLSTILLTILLLPIFKAQKSSEPGRIAWVQSDITSWVKFKEKDSTPLFPALDKPENFNFPDRYSTSKLLGMLFVTELASSKAHGQYIEDCPIQPLVPFVYTAEADRVTKVLWEETMAELSFAHVQRILSDLGNVDS